MIRLYRMGENARVAALPMDRGTVHLYVVSGASRLAVQLAEPTAQNIATELRTVLPANAPSTRRPAPPQQSPNDRSSTRPQWPLIVQRLRAGKPHPSDAEHVAGLLSYLGVKTL